MTEPSVHLYLLGFSSPLYLLFTLLSGRQLLLCLTSPSKTPHLIWLHNVFVPATVHSKTCRLQPHYTDSLLAVPTSSSKSVSTLHQCKTKQNQNPAVSSQLDNSLCNSVLFLETATVPLYLLMFTPTEVCALLDFCFCHGVESGIVIGGVLLMCVCVFVLLLTLIGRSSSGFL